MKKVIMLTKGPNDNHKVGAEVKVDDKRAAKLIRDKHAKAAK